MSMTLAKYAWNYGLTCKFLKAIGCFERFNSQRNRKAEYETVIEYLDEGRQPSGVRRVIREWGIGGAYWEIINPSFNFYGRWLYGEYANDYLILANAEPHAQILWNAGYQAIYIPFDDSPWKELYRIGAERFKRIYTYGASNIDTGGTLFENKVRRLDMITDIGEIFADDYNADMTKFVYQMKRAFWQAEQAKTRNWNEFTTEAAQ